MKTYYPTGNPQLCDLTTTWRELNYNLKRTQLQPKENLAT